MKKLFLITCFLSSVLMLNAKAVEFKPYVGININTTVKNNYGEPKDVIDYKLKNKTTLGLNFGSKIDINNDFFTFGEIYYNIINKANHGSIHLNDANGYAYGSDTFKNLFGLNLGLGYNFNEKFNIRIFASLDRNKAYGNSDIDYTITYSPTLTTHITADSSGSETKFGYGLGFNLGYNVVENIEAKIGYKFSDTRYNDNFRTHSINLGLAYNF